MSRSETAKARQAAQTPSGPPELLAQIPGSLYTSPAFILGVVCAEFLYGFVLFAVMMAHKPDPNAVKTYIPYPGPGRPQTQIAAASTSGQPSAKPAVMSPDPSAIIVVPKKAPDKPAPAKEAAKKDAPKSKGTAKKKNAPNKKNAEKPPNATVALATPAKPDAPATPPNPTVSPGSPIGPFTSFDDPKHDCRVEWDAGALMIRVPNSVHALIPMINQSDAPRAVFAVEGDFIIQVRINPTLKPGSAQLNKELDFVYQGAGLLIWENEKNFVRLERASLFSFKEMGGSSQKVLLETYTDGKPGKPFDATLKRDAPTMLRFERRGGNLVGKYSSDNGKTWLQAKSWASEYPSKLFVGVLATNISTKPLDARYEDFTLNPPAGK